MSLVNQLKNLQRKMNQFNDKYLAQISEKKKEDGVIGFFKNKLPFQKSDSKNAPADVSVEQNISLN